MDSSQEHAEALRVARATVRETPQEPPTAYRARVMGTYALALMVSEGYGVALEWAQRAQAAARQADAPWVEADALVTIGLLASRSGEQDEAIRTFTAAHEQAAGTEMLSVELRAAYHLSRERLARGNSPRRRGSPTSESCGQTMKGWASRPTGWTCSTCTSRRTTRTASGITCSS